MAKPLCVQARFRLLTHGSLLFVRKRLLRNPQNIRFCPAPQVNRSCSGPAIWQKLPSCKHAFGFAAWLTTFLSESDCFAIPGTFAFALLRRSIAHVPALPYGKAPLRASTLSALPHGRAFGQKKEAFGWKASKNYIYQNKRGDNFYKIIIPRSCFKQITKLLNFCEL
ncbi:hypothetical protein C3V36_04785 [Lachnospiraceae bacterium oral taxon 500]|nr:hypothetical protein C3V36_04785 [Lachnospiraceae bacterium oral taxon 500]